MIFYSFLLIAGGGIGFATGRFWTQDGLLAASVAQQGVVRSLL